MKQWLSIGWFVVVVVGVASALSVKGWLFVLGVTAYVAFIFITFHAGIIVKEWWDES